MLSTYLFIKNYYRKVRKTPESGRLQEYQVLYYLKTMTLFIYLVCGCVCVYACACHGVCIWRSEANFGGFFPYSMWLLGTKLRFSGLEARSFTH